MKSDPDILAFVEKVGAKEPSPQSDKYVQWRALFRRSNYFVFRGDFMVVKISRSKRPFWGVGRDFVELLNSLDDYWLVLLVSHREGWVFNKKEVNFHISSAKWRLREADNNYKINFPLPDGNSFSSPDNFLKKVSSVKRG
ncbi:MAG: hypothetical protein JRJ03_16550 [Deltaproteobacteria bacterium]|nr:hypothetical protein [Deltaproteobacteria bacterium]